MKTFKILMTLAITAIFLMSTYTQNSFATTPDPHSVDIPVFILKTEMAPKKVRILVSNLQKRPTKVWIEDNRGKILFKATVRNHNAYGKIFDMRRLKSGNYRLVVDQGKDQQIVEPINL